MHEGGVNIKVNMHDKAVIELLLCSKIFIVNHVHKLAINQILIHINFANHVHLINTSESLQLVITATKKTFTFTFTTANQILRASHLMYMSNNFVLKRLIMRMVFSGVGQQNNKSTRSPINPNKTSWYFLGCYSH